MDYKKEYKEALGRANAKIETYNHLGNASAVKSICEIFPELKESEDERVREEIIEFFKDAKQGLELQERDNNKWQIERFETFLSWLEKQDPKKHEEELENAYKCADEVQYRRGYEDAKREFEKQCEQKPTDKVEPKFKVGDVIENINNGDTVKIEQILDNCYCYSGWNGAATIHSDFTISEQDNWELVEQKPTDEVEPKSDIEKGKWYVCDIPRYKDFVVGKVYYCPKNGMLKPNENEMARYVASYGFHLWTIQDAKDGDVLCCESGWTCIFKTLNSDISFSSYCFMDKTGWFCEAGSESHTLEKTFIKAYNGNIYPATKEQRDTLLKAMADAGYTFDFEKKELKKIEQKPSWSEEDEEMIDAVIADIQFTQKAHIYDDNQIVYEREIAWLKSLKERYTWKPSDEQMKALNYVINLMASSEISTENDYYYNVFKSMKTQLKKLREE